MKQFKDLGITAEADKQPFTGDKIKVDRILGKEITVYGFDIKPSQFGKAGAECLYMQIAIGEEKRVVFTSSYFLMRDIKKIAPDNFPFKTTITKPEMGYQFN